jgi:hypothetical protein
MNINININIPVDKNNISNSKSPDSKALFKFDLNKFSNQENKLQSNKSNILSPVKKQSENSISKYFKDKKDVSNNTIELLNLKSEKEKEKEFNLDVPILERNKMRKFLNVEKKATLNRLNTITNDSISSGYKNNFNDGFNINDNNRKYFNNLINSNTFNTSTLLEKTKNDNKLIDLKDFEDKINRYNEIDNSLRYMNSGKKMFKGIKKY